MSPISGSSVRFQAEGTERRHGIASLVGCVLLFQGKRVIKVVKVLMCLIGRRQNGDERLNGIYLEKDAKLYFPSE